MVLAFMFINQDFWLMTSDRKSSDRGGDLLRNSLLFREHEAEQQEVLKHKWIESEKVGHDIGYERALVDWRIHHRTKWWKARQVARN